jgi:hypothetical protein
MTNVFSRHGEAAEVAGGKNSHSDDVAHGFGLARLGSMPSPFVGHLISWLMRRDIVSRFLIENGQHQSPPTKETFKNDFSCNRHVWAIPSSSR